MTIQGHQYETSTIFDRNWQPKNITLSLQTQQMRGFVKLVPKQTIERNNKFLQDDF